MGVSARDRAVLKLLFPGRQVEIHRRPVTAAEIMSKYPRHCVARPDVFKNPWIVVKPEAVLVPGKVFLIIPYNTLYHLLKANGYRSQHLSQQTQSPDPRIQHYHHNYEHDHYYDGRNSPPRSIAGTTPKHLGHDRNQRRQSRPPNRTHLERTHHYYDLYQRSSSFDSRPSHSQSHGNRSNPAKPLRVARPGHLHMGSAERVELKSCLRKQNSGRKLLNLRVTFGLPVVIPTSPRDSPSDLEDYARAYYSNDNQY